ncbi:MAG: tRNA (adenosine(37)-N6)-threonylcarbamoyltransferase complex dimerization subunit type 1 TsaB, partial [Mesorhizobium sp.]
DIGPTSATADIAIYARLATIKGEGEKPKPLYLRGADAKPQAGFILSRKKAGKKN